MSALPRSTPLQPGDKFHHGTYFSLEVKQLPDGVYPFIKTGLATTVIPWRYDDTGNVDICLLKQSRADTGSTIIKACGGYNMPDKDFDDSAKAHLEKKLGVKPGKHPIVWWRKCLGVGPQYDFPIRYGFLYEPDTSSSPLTPGCEGWWTSMNEALQIATAETTQLFDDLSLAQMAILSVRHRTFR